MKVFRFTPWFQDIRYNNNDTISDITIPFSDPITDGLSIQEASYHAFAEGHHSWHMFKNFKEY